MNSFLDRLALAYFNNFNELLPDTIFVFPNKRSGAFFRKSLHEAADGQLFFEPEIITIAEFIERLSGYTLANRFELLATLYDEYRVLSPEVEDFDRFVFWGDMLIKDFNDIDLYLANPHELFANVRNLREISTDYITDEQRAVIEEYWNVSLPLGNPDSFWSHIHHDSTGENHTTRDGFLALWEILDQLYANFNDSLSERGLTYTGHQYREVAATLSDTAGRDGLFGARRVVMAGFNQLSIAEIKIFEALRSMGIGDFYWETDFPSGLLGPDSTALRFINRYRKKFPSLIDIDRTTPELPHIDIVSIPSAVGQTKYISSLLDTWSKGNDERVISDPGNAIDTAIVLPTEELFVDLLHSIPPQFAGGVNVTMGLPLRMTPVAMLIGSVTRLHQRASMIRSQWHFYYEDICDVLANPLLNNILPEECNALRDMLEQKRMFTVPAELINQKYPALSDVFYGIDNLRDAEPVFDYSIRLIDFIDGLLPEDDGENSSNLERGFLLRYRQALQTLHDTLDSHNITLKENTFFALIDRAIASETVAFKGEPLRGLQIMGVLETRTLNFDNVIVMSMNDRIYPRRHWSNSFIPETLRRAYGVSTAEIQESMSAYYFYRLISGAKRVILLYDSRTESGDPSRYIHQLQFNLPAGSYSTHQYAYSISPAGHDGNFSIAKTPGIMRRISRYTSRGDDARSLSASSINTYLSCPLQFYFAYIQDLKVADEIVDYIDHSDYGSILHLAAENIYKAYRGNGKEVLITREILDEIATSPTIIPREVTNAINRIYNRLDNQHPDAVPGDKNAPYLNLTALTGEALIIHSLIVTSLRKMFELEKRDAPFYFIEGEMKVATKLDLGNKLTINLYASIDRVDRMPDGTIRIIDYKTGRDVTETKAIVNLFDPDGITPPNKAVRQLFIYANAYARHKHYDGPIQPSIYALRSVATQTEFNPVTINGIPMSDYRIHNNQVLDLLASRLGTLFDPETPITPDPSEDHCHYCKYKLLCGVAKERNY